MNNDDTKMLVGTDDKLPDDITLKNVLILCVIKHAFTFVIKFIHKYL